MNEYVVTYRGEDITSAVDQVVQRDDGSLEVRFRSGDVAVFPEEMIVGYWEESTGDVWVSR